MYQDLLEKIADLRRDMHLSDLQTPATEELLSRLRQRTHDELEADLPEGYLNFLRVTDGLNWNGLCIYASDKNSIVGKPAAFMHSFVEDNLNWRSYDLHKSYLFFADGDISLYAYNLLEGRYELQDRSSGDVISVYATFDELITAALKEYLPDDEEEEDE